ncbi:Leucine-rich repeat-containing N-terminal, plant-type [Dillenia turbinata]|uniref:Leucine-rich repeat-containing N-terminal, plant-type n=1 Tax=Dillenia turbinata TaxID=194707 RepID=A0AAN8Z089_9MAGN
MKLSQKFALLFTISLSQLVSSTHIAEYYGSERDALLQIRDTLNSTSDLHSNWTGPPCTDNRSRWRGIVCLNGHVVHLVLEGIHLTGTLPPAFLQNITFLSKLSLRNNLISGPLPSLTNLTSLRSVFLSQNQFSGPIPSDYIYLPRLQKLKLQENSLEGRVPPFYEFILTDFNVSYNHLGGQVPDTQVLQSFSKSSFDHNEDLCGSPLDTPCPAPAPAPAPVPASPLPSPAPIVHPPPAPSPLSPSNGKSNKNLEAWSIALIAAGAALIPFMFILFSCYYKRERLKEAAKNDNSREVSVEKRADSFVSGGDPERTIELEFFDKDRPSFDMDELLRAAAEVLGKGKLGTMYKAALESGSVVVVKRLKEMSNLSKKDFAQQMQLLGKMRHENLVEIISFYHSKDEKLVIYEYIPQGNLFELLHENRGAGRVPLNWKARLSIIKDIAKGLNFLHQSLPSHRVLHANLKSSNVLIRHSNGNHIAKLTDFGFLPLLPSRKSCEKLAIGKRLSDKADVYCFGIIILEVLTGRDPSGFSETVVNNDWSTDILDVEILATSEGHDEMLKLTQMALECTDLTPEMRPKMSEVVRRIQEIESGNIEIN